MSGAATLLEIFFTKKILPENNTEDSTVISSVTKLVTCPNTHRSRNLHSSTNLNCHWQLHTTTAIMPEKLIVT